MLQESIKNDFENKTEEEMLTLDKKVFESSALKNMFF